MTTALLEYLHGNPYVLEPKLTNRPGISRIEKYHKRGCMSCAVYSSLSKGRLDASRGLSSLLLLFLEIVALTVHNLLFSSTKENVRDIGCLSRSLVVLGGQSLPGVRAMTVPSFEIVNGAKTQPGLRSWVAFLLSGFLNSGSLDLGCLDTR
jgi:hypothetical protein